MAEKDEMDLRQDNPGRAWYVIHTYSGYENKVKACLLYNLTLPTICSV